MSEVIPMPYSDTDLRRLGEIAAELGAARLRAEAEALSARIAEGRFYVACIGQFKRGKSTLLNALVGKSILPAAIVPVTAVPTVLRFGATLNARVQFKSGSPAEISMAEIEGYVSEEHNPLNAKNVEIVEVFVPSRLLATGMCLVDTPGIASVFSNNTTTTREFIPHIDAALAVIGADPPISGDELSLIEQVAMSSPRILFALNKADRFTEEERAEAVTFTNKILSHRLGDKPWRVYAVSATEQLAGVKTAAGERDWPALVEALEALALEGGRQIVRESAARGVSRIAGACDRDIAVAMLALRDPLEASDRRLARLQDYIKRVEYELPRLDAMLGIERQRVSERVSQRRDDFLATTVPIAVRELTARMQDLKGRVSAMRGAAIVLARRIAEEKLQPWFTEEERVAEELYRGATVRFIELANTLLAELVSGTMTAEDVAHSVTGNAGANGVAPQEALQVGAHALDPAEGLTEGSRFYFHDVESLVRSALPLSGALDNLRPRAMVRRQAESRAAWYLTQLLDINSTRVRNDLDDRMLESTRRLAGEIRLLLQDLVASAERSLVRARAAHAIGATNVAAEIGRLSALEAEVWAIRRRESDITTHGATEQ